jgi:gamma-glutamyl-gamma-aminobutyrate hydrolase PuuD/choline kinase
MKVIILAAGIGSRLNKYTERLPKGMLPLAGKPLLQRQIETFQKAGIKDIIIVKGYKSESINFPNIKYYYDPEWSNKETNMVVSLFCAEKEFDSSDDVLVAYADTIHEPRVIHQIIKENYPLSKVIDTDYKDYWTARNGDWKIDSESCTLNSDSSIKEIGEDGVTDPSRLDGRDASLTFISKEMAPKVLEHYKKMLEKHKDQPVIDGKPVKKFNMTNLLQSWIDNGWTVMANKIKRGWMEFDTNEDYENAIKWTKTGKIKDFINLDLIENKKLRIAITQKHIKNDFGRYMDILENSYIEFFSDFNIELIPVSNVIVNVQEYLENLKIDAIVLTGGNGVLPSLYGQEIKFKNSFSEKREEIEKEVLDYAVEKNIPVFGICRGLHFINVYFKGNLLQNIKEELKSPVEHVAKDHEIEITDDKFFNEREIIVNSFHNQAITKDMLSEKLKPFAICNKDQTIEAAFHPDLPIAAVTWHPERQNPESGTNFNQKLVNAFLNKEFFWK